MPWVYPSPTRILLPPSLVNTEDNIKSEASSILFFSMFGVLLQEGQKGWNRGGVAVSSEKMDLLPYTTYFNFYPELSVVVANRK